MQSHMVCDPERGDETFSGLKYLICEVEAASADVMSRTGLSFAEGEAVVSANLAGLAPGRICLVWELPVEFHLGYGVSMGAIIDRARKTVTGAPFRYAMGRKNLAFYFGSDVVEARRRIESEMAGGYRFNQRPRFLIEPRHLLAKIPGDMGMVQLVNALTVAVKELEVRDIDRTVTLMVEYFHATTQFAEQEVMHRLVVSTIESILMSRLRMMRWEGLAALGYVFWQDGIIAQVPQEVAVAEQAMRIKTMSRRLELLMAPIPEVSWLLAYTKRELNLMSMELNAPGLGK